MPGIFDLVQVEAALGDTPLELAPTWSALARVQSFVSEEGFGINAGLFPVGTATVIVNNGDHAGGTLQFDPQTSYRGRQLRIVEQGASQPLFHGRIDKVGYNYSGAPYAAFATLTCSSGLGQARDSSVDPDNPPITGDLDGYSNVAPVATAASALLDRALPGVPIDPAAVFSNQIVKAPDQIETTQGLLELLQRILETEGAAFSHYPDGNYFALRGRWTPFDLLDPDNPPAVTLVGHAPPYDPGEVPYLRKNLEWSDPDADYYTSATAGSDYLFTPPLTVGAPPTDWPDINFSRTELPTIRQGWVEANARMWQAVKSKPGAFPARIKVLVANPASLIAGHDTPPLVGPLGLKRHDVVLPIVGGPTVTFRCILTGIRHEADVDAWHVSYGYESLDRWADAYPYDPLRLGMVDGDADHGIDSGAIFAP